MAGLKVIRVDREAIGLNLDLEAAELKKYGAEISAANAVTEDEIINAAKDADGIVTGAVLITSKVLKSLPKLKVVVRYGVGYDNIDVDAASEAGVVVAYIPDYCYEEVSNHAIGMLLALSRKMVIQNNLLKSGKWKEAAAARPPMGPIFGETLGIIGTGNIGRLSSRKGAAFGLKVIGYDPYVERNLVYPYGVTFVDLPTLLKESDYISIHVPLNKETHHMIGEKELTMMKPTAYLINTARGRVVDEKALIKALQDKKIAGAGIDVFEQEPTPPENPLLHMDNVVVTPHSAFFSAVSVVRQIKRVGDEAGRVLAGMWPKNVANKGVKPKFPLVLGA
jgi:D-3-phosphoglycerate dehydrogenase / 2-oxoglutarate reductase